MSKVFSVDFKNLNRMKCQVENRRKEKVASIEIYGPIGESFFDDSVSAKAFNEELKNLPKDVTNIEVRLNSPGGSVFDGMTIYERLRQHKANVTVYIDGLAASIASVIAMAGDKVYIGEGALVMIHRPMAGVMGNTDEMLRMIEVLEKIENQMIGIYERNTDVTSSELQEMLLDDYWMEAKEAVNKGFADEFASEEANVAAVASMIDSSEWIRKRPEIKTANQVVQEELKNKIKEMKSSLTRQ